MLAFNYCARFAAWPPRRVLGFWVLRLARIYPVHFVTLLAVAAMVIVGERLGYQLTDAGYSTRDFILNLFLMHTWVPDFRLNWNYPSWSISSEWFAYLLFPFAAATLLVRLTTPTRSALFALVCLIGAGIVFSFPQFPFRELVMVIPTFFAGTAIYSLTRDRPTATSCAVRWLPDLLFAALAVACFLPHVPGTLFIVFTLFGLVLALARLANTPHRWWELRPLIYLGEVSYSLYMTHTLAQKGLYRLLPSARYESSDSWVRSGIVIVYAVALMASCLASYYLVEKPFRHWFRKRLGERA